MKYRYYTCDVFTETRFGGNPLAVLPQAEGLSDEQMQQIAREFNFSETSFVFPPQSGHTRQVRIFTPGREVPFAGHPNVGTAFILATTGELGEIGSSHSVTFEEKAGLVPVSIRAVNGMIASCELTAPQPLSVGKTIPVSLVAPTVSVTVDDIATDAHQPQVVSVGLPFVITELKNRSILERCRVNAGAFDAIAKEEVRPSLYFYVRAEGDVDLRARMFAPLSGVPEDPATGSANCAIAGFLAHLDRKADGAFAFRVAQGVEMGRPSSLLARAEKAGGAVKSTGVGGACVFVSEGYIHAG